MKKVLLSLFIALTSLQIGFAGDPVPVTEGYPSMEVTLKVVPESINPWDEYTFEWVEVNVGSRLETAYLPNNQYLVCLPPGEYTTSDAFKCAYVIDAKIYKNGVYIGTKRFQDNLAPSSTVAFISIETVTHTKMWYIPENW